MQGLRLAKCQITECDKPASAMVVLGTQYYCVEALTADAKTAGLLLRLDLCPTHIALLGANFTEIQHDPQLPNYSDVAAFSDTRAPREMRI